MNYKLHYLNNNYNNTYYFNENSSLKIALDNIQMSDNNRKDLGLFDCIYSAKYNDNKNHISFTNDGYLNISNLLKHKQLNNTVQ